MLTVGDSVHHKNEKESFGRGTILKIDEVTGSALVEWESHEVSRESDKLSKRQSHVGISNLVKI